MSFLSSHASLDQLELYLLHRLDGDGLDGVEIHLLLCENCRQKTTEVEREIMALHMALSAGE